MRCFFSKKMVNINADNTRIIDRILGLDVGTRTIGIAISDPLGLTAQGITTWQRTGQIRFDLKKIEELVEKYEVKKIVVGLPKNLDGSLGTAVNEVKDFTNLLTNEIGIEVIFWDERLSTVEAEKVLLEGDLSRRKRKKVIDKIAAVLILQSYLDRLNNNRLNNNI